MDTTAQIGKAQPGVAEPGSIAEGEAEPEAGPVEQPYSVGQHIFKLRAPRWG